MGYSMHRIFCATPEGLEPERKAFYEIVSEFNGVAAMPRGVLLVPVSVVPRVFSFAPFDAAIRENIRQSRYYIQVLAQDFGPPERDFRPLFEEARRACGNGALREVVVLSKTPGAGVPDGIRSFAFQDAEGYRDRLLALFQEWLEDSAPAGEPPAQGLALRPAAPEDEPFLRELLTATVADQLAAWAWDGKMRETLLRMQVDARRTGYRQQYPDADESIVLVDGQPAGYLIVLRREDSIRLVDIAIAAPCRNRGLGARLIRELLEESDRSGKPVRLQVALHSPALRLYQRLGFVPTGGNDVVLELERAPHPAAKGPPAPGA